MNTFTVLCVYDMTLVLLKSNRKIAIFFSQFWLFLKSNFEGEKTDMSSELRIYISHSDLI